MRRDASAARIQELLRALGDLAPVPVRLWLVGGSTAVLEGWRDTTKDVDFVFEPEPAALYEGMARLKDQLDINLELAAPSHFVPEVPGWRDRSRYVSSFGKLHVYHYDPVSQALAKIERGHHHDLPDVDAMFARGWLDREALRAAFAAIEPNLIRYPALDPDMFRAKVEAFLRDRPDAPGG